MPLTCAKITDRLNAATRVFIERSPFVCIATSDATGRYDVSPRGDPAGFVRILDDRTLLMPERPGNRPADTLRNVLANPHVGLIFVVPGATDTFRVNGRAALTTDAALLVPCALEGRTPKLGLLVDIEEAYTQCSKALLRSQFWDATRFIDPATMPTGGEVLRAIQGEGFDAARYDSQRPGVRRRRAVLRRWRRHRKSPGRAPAEALGLSEGAGRERSSRALPWQHAQQPLGCGHPTDEPS